MMKKNVQSKLLDMVNTMEEVNETLLSLVNSGHEKEFVELLTDLQAFAIELGNKIEEHTGEVTQAVKLLEEFCEAVWRCSQGQTIREKERIIFEMKVYTLEIRQEIKELPATYDVVFLPYKASMWDSMESVWRAAREDKSCSCHVIPIPYYDKNKDGTLGKINYEKELFPEYVPVTDYRSYSIEENKPDIIYIHNPYDSFNHVTSVEPSYYSKELKKHTSMLVYIPYYCTDGDLPKGHEQFVAYYMADKIIVQNDRTKESLLKLNNTLPGDKVAALGSPKFDRMIYLDKNKPEIMSEWKDLLTDKKIFLVNTSISGVLKDGNKFLDKLESILKAFMGREDIALIWRPHPLLRATLESMRPELASRYDRIIKWYKDERIGIYDRTPDVNNTVAISDAYIGEEGSSVVHLFGILGKPIFIMSDEPYEQHSVEELSEVEFMDCALEGSKVWFVSMHSNFLCQMDTDTGIIEILGKIPETENTWEVSYVNIIKYKDRLIMMPYSADGICEYDLSTGQFCKYYIKKEYVNLKFGRMIQYNTDLYLLPQEYSAIIRYNLENRSITYYHECIGDIKSKAKKRFEWSPFVWGACSYKNLLFLASAWSNHILIFNMDSGDYDVHEVGDATNLYRGIVADELHCWLIMQNKSCVVKWNRITGETIEYDKYPEGFSEGSVPFKNILKFEDKLYLISCHASHSIEMDANTGETSFTQDELNANTATAADKLTIRHHFAKRISDKAFCVFQPNSHSYIEVDTNRNIQKRVICHIEKEHWIREAVDSLKYRQAKYETYPFTLIENEEDLLTKFIEYVKSDMHDKEKVKAFYDHVTEYSDGSSGSHIHDYVLKCMGYR